MPTLEDLRELEEDLQISRAHFPESKAYKYLHCDECEATIPHDRIVEIMGGETIVRDGLVEFKDAEVRSRWLCVRCETLWYEKELEDHG